MHRIYVEKFDWITKPIIVPDRIKNKRNATENNGPFEKYIIFILNYCVKIYQKYTVWSNNYLRYLSILKIKGLTFAPMSLFLFEIIIIF